MLSYPARIARDGARFMVSFVDIPEALSDGGTREEAMAMAADALTTAINEPYNDPYKTAAATVPMVPGTPSTTNVAAIETKMTGPHQCPPTTSPRPSVPLGPLREMNKAIATGTQTIDTRRTIAIRRVNRARKWSACLVDQVVKLRHRRHAHNPAGLVTIRVENHNCRDALDAHHRRGPRTAVDVEASEPDSPT